MTTARASVYVGQRVREARLQLDLTAKQLANQCAAVGAPDLTAAVIANIETGRRGDVSIDRVLTLAYVLGVPPMYLLLPFNEDEALEITADVIKSAIPSALWLTGDVASPDLAAETDSRRRAQWRKIKRSVETLKDLWSWVAAYLVVLRGAHGYPETDAWPRIVLREAPKGIGRVVEQLLDLAITPPPLPREVIDAIRTAGALKDPDEVPAADDGDLPDWLAALESAIARGEVQMRGLPPGVVGMPLIVGGWSGTFDTERVED